MSPSMAGATITGAAVARQVAVMTSPARPLAIAASQWAVAGATRIGIGRVGGHDVGDALVGQQLERVQQHPAAGQRRRA